MKIASFGGGRIGLVVGDEIVDVSELVEGYRPGSWPPIGMLGLIANFDGLSGRLAELAVSGARRPLASVPSSASNGFHTRYPTSAEALRS